MTQTWKEPAVMFGTEDILTSLCNSVADVLTAATTCEVNYAGMVQRISKTCLKPDIGCFVLFDGSFSGLVVLNFSAAAAMEIYRRYMLNMGMPADSLAHAHTSDEVSSGMGELMNQIVGDFTSKLRRELQTTITQNQPKMLVLNKQVVLSVDTQLDQPEVRRVTFYTESNNIFYLELAIDRTEFIKLRDFEVDAKLTPDEVLARAGTPTTAAPGGPAAGAPSAADEHAELLKSLGM